MRWSCSDVRYLYIKRADIDEDRDRYQTVFARVRGSVRADRRPTFHVRPAARARQCGDERLDITLRGRSV